MGCGAIFASTLVLLYATSTDEKGRYAFIDHGESVFHPVYCDDLVRGINRDVVKLANDALGPRPAPSV